MQEAAVRAGADIGGNGHRRWVRISHWVIAFSIITLGMSGVFILAVHPRLYWGEVGNDLVPAILEIPISANHRPEGFERTVDFAAVSDTAFSANRNYEIFNQNGWARSLHFLAAWFFLIAGMIYVLAGFASGHARSELLPKGGDFSLAKLGQDLREHLRPKPGAIGAGPPYGIVQRISYGVVLFIAMPLMVLTGISMAPAITAAFPFLLDIFGGYQSARTIHFFSFAVLLLFFFVHVAMVFVTGFGRQMRAMILGK
jgi:thiosulfate reductase cytochrome b subunit